ncbi:MAG: prolyl oligopeptidase family serine peptidase, partial [Firmicutes bacterium]|nr:prolyl oligopeptidase family serine peptidase [Bacillota bacterium]
MRKRIKAGILALLLAGILMLGGCIPNYKVGGKALIALSKETREVKETLVKNLFTMLNGDSASFLDTLSTNSKVSFENEWEFWQEQVRTYGAYEGYIYKEGWAYGEDIIFCVTASLNGHEIEVDSCWDERNRLKQLVFYTPAEEEEASVHIPDGVEEIEITLGEGTDHPLNGRITKPKQTNGACPAVVLIPGNGSADMDFTAGVTHPYRDIAWGLAEQGIVTIRFDKRVKTYGDEWTEAPSFENLTIDWEFADDAVMALDMLKAQDFVDPQRIFIAGHSLGGL